MTGTGNAFRSDRLKERREALGLTQGELAVRIGVTLNMVYRYETENAAEPNSGTLAKLADALGVSADWLLDRTDDMGGLFTDTLSDRERNLIAEIRRRNAPDSMRALAELLTENH